MGLFRKKADPISQRSRVLKAEIAQLEAQIKKLHSQADRPDVATAPVEEAGSYSAAVSSSTFVAEPILENADHQRLAVPSESVAASQYFNDLGVRKYDLPALLRRIRGFFQSQPVANPKLVTFLAAGSIQGLRPLRYEKRIARNRFIFLAVILLAMLWGLATVLIRNR
jgi:hypothetical protein